MIAVFDLFGVPDEVGRRLRISKFPLIEGGSMACAKYGVQSGDVAKCVPCGLDQAGGLLKAHTSSELRAVGVVAGQKDLSAVILVHETKSTERFQTSLQKFKTSTWAYAFSAGDPFAGYKELERMCQSTGIRSRFAPLKYQQIDIPCPEDGPISLHTTPLNTRAAQELSALPLWSLADSGEYITRTLVAKNFLAAMTFLNKVAEISEDQGHHPDLHLTQYRHVEIRLQTHSIGGVTQNDILLAKLLDDLPVEYSPKWLREHPEAAVTHEAESISHPQECPDAALST